MFPLASILLAGIDIDKAGSKVHLKALSLRKLPADIRAVA
jgi:hypothetical protein